jgi:2-deoxy-D-gluconate 3-dehydrogenase
MKYQLDFSGKTVLVTGGAEGIGKAICAGFASLGARVIVLDLREEKMPVAVGEIKKQGREVVYHACDISNDQQTDSVLSRIDDEMKGVDILINNAGIYKTGPSVDYSYADWDKLYAVNVRAQFFITVKVAKRFMLPKKAGCVVFLSSTAAHVGVPMAVAYGVSKASTLQMTKALAAEWAADNIRVNAVNPFFVATNLISSISKEQQDTLAQTKTYLKRLAQPEEIVGAILFLCSDMASYITGAHLNIDGGRSIL